jgi:preprotein translocase subunit YajC
MELLLFVGQVSTPPNQILVVQSTLSIIATVVSILVAICGGVWFFFKATRREEKDVKDDTKARTQLETGVENLASGLKDVLSELREVRNELKVVTTHTNEIDTLKKDHTRLEQEVKDLRIANHEIRNNVMKSLFKLAGLKED